MKPQLVIFEWDGEAMQPLKRFRQTCDQEFTVGETYRMDVQEERSMRSHNHYFACVQDAWNNLPEHEAERFPSPEHLRAWALCHGGYCDIKQVVAENEEQARHVAGVMRALSEYAVITVARNVTTAYIPQSQSMKAMGKERFMESKNAVLDVLAKKLGVTAKQLKGNVR